MEIKQKVNVEYLLAFMILLLVEIFIAVYVHDNIVRSHIGDVLVVILLYCFARIVLRPYGFLPLCIFLFAVLVELLQAFDLVTLLGLKPESLMGVIMGSTFDWADIFCYAIGGLLLLGWQRFIKSRKEKRWT